LLKEANQDVIKDSCRGISKLKIRCLTSVATIILVGSGCKATDMIAMLATI